MNSTNLTPKQRQRFFIILDKYQQFRSLSREEKEDLIIRITSTEYIDLLCDWAFKHVFGHNKEHLMMLLNDFLPMKIVDIDEIHYEPNEVDRFKGDDKQVIMDVLCHTETEHIIVEMQKSNSNEFRNRMVYYGASMFSRQLKPKDKYSKLKPVYVICFMNFRLLHQTDQLVYRYQIREQDSNELYGNQLSIYQCELPRFAGVPERELSPVEQWFDILQNMNNFVSRPAHLSKRFDPIFEACRQNKLGSEELEQYFNAMLTEDEIQSIGAAYKEEGFREGMEKGKKDTARNLISLGVALETVSKATGIPVKELENLQA